MLEINKIHVMDCLDGLKLLDDCSVNCCVTSPPYYNLRDYGIEGQIGLETTPDEYIEKLVETFREVRRVLRDDGTLFLNIGDSYAGSGKGGAQNPENAAKWKQGTNKGMLGATACLKVRGMSNIVNCLHALLKGCLVFGFDGLPVAQSAQSINIAPFDQGTKNFKFSSFFSMKPISDEQRNDDFSEVFDFFTIPRNRWIAMFGCMESDKSTTDIISDVFNCRSVISADLDADLQAKFTIRSSATAGTGKNNNTTFSVEKPTEPRTKIRINWHADWDTFANTALRKCVPNINPMDNAISFGNCLLPFACDFSDFFITSASEKQLTLTSIERNLIFTVTDISHLYFLLPDGCLVPYKSLYAKAIQMSRQMAPKNQLLIPFRLASALQKDGWILRQTIIWSKPNPMPESVRDRCTKSHEYMFLLSKSPRYYYDAEAIAEPVAGSTMLRLAQNIENQQGSERVPGKTNGPMKARPPRYGGNKYTAEPDAFNRTKSGNAYDYRPMRNKRDVWTVATQPFSAAHFATFPPKLIEPCILAGCPKGGIVCDPFMGSGTTAKVAIALQRNYIGFEINPEYVDIANEHRLDAVQLKIVD